MTVISLARFLTRVVSPRAGRKILNKLISLQGATGVDFKEYLRMEVHQFFSLIRLFRMVIGSERYLCGTAPAISEARKLNKVAQTALNGFCKSYADTQNRLIELVPFFSLCLRWSGEYEAVYSLLGIAKEARRRVV